MIQFVVSEMQAMGKMNQKEIKNFINGHRWATLCTVDPEGKPYAIEFTCFLMDDHVCGLINPRGTSAKNVKNNPNVCLKMCRMKPQKMTGVTSASCPLK